MKLLAIDTSTPAASVALSEDRDVIAAASRNDRRGHASFLVPAIDFCFDQAGWSPDQLDAVIVDTGPGLYTGIRVGLATAQGLAAAIGIPVIPASSLDALALRAATGRRHIWAIVDVRRGEFAVAAYRPVPGGVVRGAAPQLVDADRLRALIESDPDDVLLVGDVASLPDATLRGLHRVRQGRPRYPAAEALLEIGLGIIARGEVPHPDDLRPQYLRDPDVTINWAVLNPVDPWAESE